LEYDVFARERHSLIGNLGKFGFMLSQFALISTRQFDIAVQDDEDAFAYAIREFPFTVQNDSFMHSYSAVFST